ncbi:TPA: DUF551 domain-containing protein [Klebsiella michiganensis]|nr:DUF551 domain-containing protein [Klebsiella michiganensis]HED2786364.1 DUF551 domain-containing protein [Klebsiella michiganensis]HED2795183.1 DUF551 domain-containing protein [Klebsiella michiganensis]HED2799733.1 DUF551 domain-containing protein [Klebsiella michiganensis]HED2805988.1 DUF551 domain-containing protein [Klebsiella michiganensis]
MSKVSFYRHAQQPVVDADDNFYSWFGREWAENYQYNQYTTAAKQMLGVMAESAWIAATERQRQKQSVSVPDVKIYEDVPYGVGRFKTHRDCYCDGWNACRAAMLNHPSSIQPNTDAATGTEIKHPSSNSPVIPEGYVMVPKEPTRQMMAQGHFAMKGTDRGKFRRIYLAMIAAAQRDNPALDSVQSVATVPGKWVPVSERMPGSQEWVIVFAKWANQQVLCWDDVQNRWTDFEDQSYYADMFTHWMPLPAGPKEEK